jgi:hypothetical protein
MRPTVPNLHVRTPGATVRGVLAALFVLVAPPGALWTAGNYRHHQDIVWCSHGLVDNPHKLVVDDSCVARRESRRWGPFLAFGPSANRSQD